MVAWLIYPWSERACTVYGGVRACVRDNVEHQPLRFWEDAADWTLD